MNSWRRASNFGILRDPTANFSDSRAPWHSARLFDVLRVGGVASGPLLVASPQSGLWIVSTNGGLAIPLSFEWGGLPVAQPGVWSGNIPNTVCLAQGLYSPEHVYVGGGQQVGRPVGAALSETDTTKPDPLSHWRDIPIADANKNSLGAGAINRIVVVSQFRKLVLACDNGVFWAQIPPPGGTYIFQQAAGLPPGRFSGLALSQGLNIIAGAWGTDLGLHPGSPLHAGIFVGTWASFTGPLNFTPAKISGVRPGLMRRIDIASTPADPRVLYAVSGGGNPTTPQTDSKGNVIFDSFGNVIWQNDNDFILCVLRSGDGGSTWSLTGRTLAGTLFGKLFPGKPGQDVLGHSQDGYCGCIAVTPFDARFVAIGVGLSALSLDSGSSWRVFDESSPHVHADTHGLLFDPSDRNALHICSDGGLATTSVDGLPHWSTGGNRQLPDLEFYKTTASPKDSGLIAGSLQDNGNVFAPLYIQTDPWQTLEGGDGVMTQFVSTGDLLRQNNTLTQVSAATGLSVDYGRMVRAAAWDSTKRRFNDRSMFPVAPLSFGVIPVDESGTGLSVPTNEDGLELTEPVATPTFTNDDGEPMIAVGSNQLQVLGLFSKSDGNSHWEELGNIPDNGANDYISAVTSPDGTFVYIGTNNGNLYHLDASGSLFNLTAIFPAVSSARIMRIVALNHDDVFLIAGATVLHVTISAGAATATVLTGKVLPSGVSATLPTGQEFNAMAADPTTNPPTLYACTAFSIFVSPDLGESWLPFNEGLPTAPSCQDLRWVQEASQVSFLYAATQGWSVFRRVLNVQEGVSSTIVVDGQMDLYDRFLLDIFEGEDASFIWFNESRVMGPFHPLDNMKFHGDETSGGEVSADLNLDLLWKVDSSVDVNWNASMSTDEDDESDSSNGTVNVPSGSAKTITVDFKTDDIEPDRVHIEFTATN